MTNIRKCPRCKAEAKKEDTFCKSCGSPLGRVKPKKEKSKKAKEKTIIEEKKEKEETPVIAEVKEKIETKEEILNAEEVVENTNNNKEPKNNKVLIAILVVIILTLGSITFYLTFLKEEKECPKCPEQKECEKCQKCEVCEECEECELEFVGSEQVYQYINFKGYHFEMPIDWKFMGDTDEYKFINDDEDIYVLITENDTKYEEFVAENFQKKYVETLQNEHDITINKRYEKVHETEGITYYILEGLYESYDYIIVVVEKEDGIFLIESQFKDSFTYSNKKQEVIDFAISKDKNSDM